MNIKTTISEEPMDLSELFATPEPTDTNKSTLFDNDNTPVDVDEEEDEVEVIPAVITPAVKPAEESKPEVKTVAEVVVTPNLEDIDNEEFEEAKAGTKSGLIEFFKTKIEAGELVPFDDFDETKQTIDDYLKTFKSKDFDSLWKDNMESQKKEMASALPQEFFESLPQELQYAAKYVADGGTDLKSLFKVLAQVEEVKALDPVADARKLNEQYLIAKNFGSAEVIKEQLDEWDDLNMQEKKATKFKPEMDTMQEAIIKGKLDAQAEIDKQKKQQYNFYHDNVVEAIRTEDLGGIKLDKKTQAAIYTGLTQHNHTDSRGKVCSEFEYLLDQVMWVKPDYKKLAKVQWLLQDEEGFEKALANKKINENTEETVRTLKTEQAKKRSSTPENPAPPARKTIPRNGGGLFSR